MYAKRCPLLAAQTSAGHFAWQKGSCTDKAPRLLLHVRHYTTIVAITDIIVQSSQAVLGKDIHPFFVPDMVVIIYDCGQFQLGGNISEQAGGSFRTRFAL